MVWKTLIVETIQLSDFDVAETKTFVKSKQKINPKVYKKIQDIVYPQLRKNPYFGANIKRLKGDLSPYYRYRIGSYRLFYLIDDSKVVVVIVDLKYR